MMVNYNSEKREMRLTTAHGTLVATAFDDPDYPGISIDFSLTGDENGFLAPIALIEDCDKSVSSSETRGDAVIVRVYGDCESEEYTNRVDIPIKNIKRVYDNDAASIQEVPKDDLLNSKLEDKD